MPTINVKDLSVKYKNKKETTTVYENFNITFEDGKISSIVGFSGCGKTTLLRAIAGLIPYDGEVFYDDINIKDVETRDLNIAFVSQKYVLYSHLSVFDNIAFPLKMMKAEKNEIIKRVYEIAELLDIKYLLSRKPRQLSGGQQQRVAIARALIKRPTICFFDEPLSNLDPSLRLETRYLIKKIISSMNVTTVYVSHDFNEAMALSDKIYIINNGKIAISGTPKEVFAMDNEIVNSFKNAGEIKDAL